MPANQVLDLYVPEIWAAEGLMILRNKLVMAQLVYRDFDGEVASWGDTVNVNRPSTFTAKDKGLTAAVSPQAAGGQKVQVKLDQHKEVTFLIYDVEMAKSFVELTQLYLEPAMRAIAESIDADLHSLYTDIGTFTGVYATPLSPDTLVDTRTKLQIQKVPMDDRVNIHFVMSSEDEGALLKVDKFTRVNEAGDDGSAQREANLGMKYGFNLYSTQNVINAGGGHNNLAFHRNAFALVMRALPNIGSQFGIKQSHIDYDGIAMRVTMAYNVNIMAVQFTVDTLFGTKTLDQNLATIAHGA